ncbi:hypothetical protein ACFRQM_04415 [Streptomyces sp. NPDC056831]
MNTDTAPRTAREAADRLASLGHHVHYVADGETRCHTGHCARAAAAEAQQ